MTKSQHGGQREGAGRPSSLVHKRQQIIIDASDEEKQLILDYLSTRERAKILLSWIAAEMHP